MLTNNNLFNTLGLHLFYIIQKLIFSDVERINGARRQRLALLLSDYGQWTIDSAATKKLRVKLNNRFGVNICFYHRHFADGGPDAGVLTNRVHTMKRVIKSTKVLP